MGPPRRFVDWPAPRWDVLVEGRHVWTDAQTQTASGREFRLDLYDGVVVSVGGPCRF